MGGAVVAVVGARGGAGASVVAASLARAAARRRAPVCLVDLALVGGGLDVLLGVEQDPGVRWPDLADARGRLDGEDLLARLPRWGPVPVVSTERGGGPEPAALADVVAALAEATAARSGVLVLDVDRAALGTGAAGAAGAALLDACDEVLVVTPLDVTGVAGAAAVRDRVAGPAALVLRRPAPGRLAPAEVAEAVGLDVAATVGWDRALAGAVERGQGPCVGRGAVVRAGRELAARYAGPGR
ncbi:septum site-determining protein Ssd [Cellulosimicrobium composti]|uniref:Pilus assembly protein FlpE n=1 Tax=Cellulosimicrobium composti TaxID=2672572 RepID=A0ABX0BH93_9MICO|nr:septum site-determining protein Ssd [Cellulosimicrobium composti]NDO90595.1 pilus assembly protein FlpE [Cellulosimicrobium composti]